MLETFPEISRDSEADTLEFPKNKCFLCIACKETPGTVSIHQLHHIVLPVSEGLTVLKYLTKLIEID